jgi:hypothetical protein
MKVLSTIFVATALAQSSVEPIEIYHKYDVTKIDTKPGTCTYLGLKPVTEVDVPRGYGLQFFDNYDCSGLTVATGIKRTFMPKRNVADIRSVKVVDEFKITDQLMNGGDTYNHRLDFDKNSRPKRFSMDYYALYDNGVAPKLPW